MGLFFIYMTWDKNSKLFFSKGISSFSRTICWNTDLSLLNGIDTLLDIFDHICLLFQFSFFFFNDRFISSLFYPIVYMSSSLWQYHNLFWVQQILSKSHDQIMWVLQLLFFFQDYFVYLQSFKAWNSGFFLFTLLQRYLNFERDCIEYSMWVAFDGIYILTISFVPQT